LSENNEHVEDFLDPKNNQGECAYIAFLASFVDRGSKNNRGNSHAPDNQAQDNLKVDGN